MHYLYSASIAYDTRKECDADLSEVIRVVKGAYLNYEAQAGAPRLPGGARVNLQELRHSFASIAIGQLRLPVVQVAKWMGHKNARLTLEV